MGDVEQLLAQLIANPADAEVRRVYADMLTARGDPRGELIAVQCAIADRTIGRAGLRAARELERKLIAELPRSAIGPVMFTRGFVAEAFVSIETLLTRADELWAAAPFLEHVHVDYDWKDPPAIAELLASLVVTRLRGLSLHEEHEELGHSGPAKTPYYADCCGGQVADLVVAHAPGLAHLTTLCLTDIDDRAEALAGCADLAALESLELEKSIYPGGALAILDSPHLQRVRSLRVSPYHAEELAQVLSHPRVAELRELALGLVRAPDIAAVRRQPLAQLERLVLAIYHDDAPAMLAMIDAPQLRELTIRGDRASLESVRAIVDWAEARGLDRLDLSALPILSPRAIAPGLENELWSRFGGDLVLS